MLELVEAGGWLMLPIIACSIVALAIIVERVWSLQVRKVLPRNLVAQVWRTSAASNQPQRRLRPVVVPNSWPRSPIPLPMSSSSSVGKGPLPTRVV